MHPLKILLVEDDRVDVAVFQRAVRTAGIESTVTIAPNGVVALELIHRDSFDLIICDINMPLMNGFQLAKTINQERISTPFVFLTTSHHPDDINRARELNGSVRGYFVKPTDWKNSKDLVEAVISCWSEDERLAPIYRQFNLLNMPPPCG